MDNENDINEENSIPEQLEDEDFEREKEEKKRLKAEKKANKKREKEEKKKNKKLKNTKKSIESQENAELEEVENDEDTVNTEEPASAKEKKVILFIGIIVLILAIIGVVIYIFNREEVKIGKPEDVVKDFCAYFNAKNWKKANELLDVDGYYVMTMKLEESEYTKFDETYSNIDSDDQEYQNFVLAIDTIEQADTEMLNELAYDVNITVNNIVSVVKIQNTDYLYKIKAEFLLSAEGQKETVTDTVYVALVDGQYKLVYGYLPDIMITLYQNVYMYQSYYGN